MSSTLKTCFPDEAVELAQARGLYGYHSTWSFTENAHSCCMQITWTKTSTPEHGTSNTGPQGISGVKHEVATCSSISPPSTSEPLPANNSHQTIGSKKIKREILDTCIKAEGWDSLDDIIVIDTPHNSQSTEGPDIVDDDLIFLNKPEDSFFNISLKLEPYDDEIIYMGTSIHSFVIDDDDDDVVLDNNEDVLYLSTSYEKQNSIDLTSDDYHFIDLSLNEAATTHNSHVKKETDSKEGILKPIVIDLRDNKKKSVDVRNKEHENKENVATGISKTSIKRKSNKKDNSGRKHSTNLKKSAMTETQSTNTEDVLINEAKTETQSTNTEDVQVNEAMTEIQTTNIEAVQGNEALTETQSGNKEEVQVNEENNNSKEGSLNANINPTGIAVAGPATQTTFAINTESKSTQTRSEMGDKSVQTNGHIQLNNIMNLVRQKMSFTMFQGKIFYNVYARDFQNRQEFMFIYQPLSNSVRIFNKEKEPDYFYKTFYDLITCPNAYFSSYLKIYPKFRAYISRTLVEHRAVQNQQFGKRGHGYTGSAGIWRRFVFQPKLVKYGDHFITMATDRISNQRYILHESNRALAAYKSNGGETQSLYLQWTYIFNTGLNVDVPYSGKLTYMRRVFLQHMIAIRQ